MKFPTKLIHLVAICAALLTGQSYAKPGCNDANIWGGNVITDICWSCLLPVTIMGLGRSDPPGANRQPVCMCKDKLGVPKPGFTFGSFLPFRLFEAVRNPYCMPALGGVFLNKYWMNLAGPKGGDATGVASGAYYHTHVYSYPLAEMMNLMTSKECNAGGYADMDIILMSELDPVASDDMLAMFIYFETVMFANPLAVAACAVECGTLNAGVTPKSFEMWWCAGCWGPLYPMSNTTNVRASKHTETSLITAKQLAVKHRRGLGHITYGSENMCGGKIALFLPKEQYKWQQLFPVPEAKKPCCHYTGASEYITGGVSRERPYKGEDIVHVLYRYTDCCIN